jgi:hypothetical protein
VPTGCDLCDRIERAERDESPFALVRTATGYVNLADVQYHEGYTIFVAKRCVNELHELHAAERDGYLHEMAVVAEAVFRAFRPRKLNYELLDHRKDWAQTRMTVFELLDRLCSHHHDLKTIDNWALVEGSGKRAFVPPDDPRHPRNAHGPPVAA